MPVFVANKSDVTMTSSTMTTLSVRLQSSNLNLSRVNIHNEILFTYYTIFMTYTCIGGYAVEMISKLISLQVIQPVFCILL